MIVFLLIATGGFFAVWPHAMREARFSPATALMMYGAVSCVGGLAWMATSRSFGELHGRSLAFGTAAGVANALGGLMFTWVLTQRTRTQLARDVMILLIIQVALNATWAAYQSGTFGWRLAAGTATALLTIVLLR